MSTQKKTPYTSVISSPPNKPPIKATQRNQNFIQCKLHLNDYNVGVSHIIPYNEELGDSIGEDVVACNNGFTIPTTTTTTTIADTIKSMELNFNDYLPPQSTEDKEDEESWEKVSISSDFELEPSTFDYCDNYQEHTTSNSNSNSNSYSVFREDGEIMMDLQTHPLPPPPPPPSQTHRFDVKPTSWKEVLLKNPSPIISNIPPLKPLYYPKTRSRSREDGSSERSTFPTDDGCNDEDSYEFWLLSKNHPQNLRDITVRKNERKKELKKVEIAKKGLLKEYLRERKNSE